MPDDERDEVEAHKKAASLTEEDDAEVEGHRRHSSLREDDDDEPEVEGHMRRGI